MSRSDIVAVNGIWTHLARHSMASGGRQPPVISQQQGAYAPRSPEVSVMRAVVQRVRSARVAVDDVVVGAIGGGLLVLLGVAPTDTQAEVQWLADKIVGLRVFPDADG